MIKFDEKYNYSIFSTFLREFLPKDYTEKEKDLADLERCKIINQAKELGYSESLDVYVLEMSHSKESDPRVSVATDAFKLLATYGMDRALVIFKNEESENYRFSYLTISLDLNEKNKIVRKYSNAHRYSFYLGVGAKTKTPEQQLIKRGKVVDMEDLLSRFSLEVVNKQFYLEVAKYFDELVNKEEQNLALPSQSDANVRKNFVMRLIGRIMFCWFLKQKKSKDGQLIPDEILSSNAVQNNYYHSVLEPLFFEVLNTQIEERDVRSDLYDMVPYLNGGLFSPQYDDYYDFDRGTFTSKHINTLKVSDKWFKTFFELLETYNFTIDENMVFDQELSVDPEMLGRIFENLLAEMNPETGSSERKRTGSYYTPRQIVEYMVDQSLIEYLKTKTSIEADKLSALVSYDLNDDTEHPLSDEEKQKIVNAIESLKILDPACGSGAFPIGALQKIVWILQRIDPDCKLWLEQKLAGIPELYKQKIINEVQSNPFDYTRKLDVIRNSIFGVDIQPIAVEVSRLRCFLTLVVESEIDDTKKNRGIEPLPNLDFKFVSANTLIGLPKSESNGLFEDHSGIEELSEIMSEYFSCSNQRKNEIRLRFTNTQKEILNKSLSSFGKSTGDLTLKLSLWDPFSNKSNLWFDPEWMFGIEEKFDVVIGNPPYVQLQKNSGELADLYKDSNYATYARTGDVYSLFYENGLRLAKQETGLLCYITSSKWMRSGYGEKLREYFAQKNPLRLIDLSGVKVFESAVVETNIIIVENTENKKELLACRLQNDYVPTMSLISYFKSHKTLLPDLTSQSWFIGTEAEVLLKKKIEKIGNPLKNLEVNINFGIKTGFNEAFIINKETRNELVALDEKSTHIIKPVLRGRDVERYSHGKIEHYLINTHNGYTSSTGVKISPVKIDDYPSVKTHLDTYREKLEKRADKGVTPYNLRSCAYMEEFEKEKIAWIELADNGRFCVVEPGIYTEATTFIMTFEKPKLMVGLLNSKLVNWYFDKICGESGVGTNRWKKFYVETIPLPPYEEKQCEHITTLVEKIIEKKKKDNNVDTSELENEIDEIVFDMYNLTPEEIDVIETSQA